MSGAVPLLPKFQFSNNGAPMANGAVTVYLAGTVTPSNTWQDEALTILNVNPIVLDARGEAVIYLNPALSYKFLLKNAGGVTQWTQDNIKGAGAMADIAALRADLAAPGGSALVGFSKPGAAQTVQQQLDMLYYGIANVRDTQFAGGAKGDGITDDSAAIQAALNAARYVHLPYTAASYVAFGLTSGIATLIVGVGGFSSTIKNTSAAATMLTLTNDLVKVEGIRFLGTGAKTDVGVQISGSSQRINGCYFDQLGKGVQQNANKNEYEITQSTFALCKYGVYNLGGGINAKAKSCKFVTCDTAAYISDTGAGYTTEGFTIDDALTYDCGNHAANQAVYEIITADYTRIIGGMHDGNNAWVFRALDSKRCEIGGMAYLANNFAPINVSTILLQGDCTAFNGGGARVEFSPYYGFQATGPVAGGCSDINLTGIQFGNNNSLGGGGDVLIDSCTDTRITSCVLGTSGSVSVAANATYRAADVTVVNSRCASGNAVASGCVIRGSNNSGFVLSASGINVIPNGSTAVTFAHGLNVLAARQVVVTLTNAQDFKPLSASVAGANITVTNNSAVGDTTFFWSAQVV